MKIQYSKNSLADEMVKSQIENRGINDPNVLSAMREIPRHVFLSSVTDYRAYGDYPLSIGFEQTISQPYIVAYMTEVLELSRKDRVLEIGTGTGYIAIKIARKVRRVVASDLNPYAVKCAKKNAEINKVKHKIDFLLGDLFKPIRPGEIFDLIIFNAPYLPVEPGEEKIWIGRAWAGGKTGREIIDRFISDAPKFLRRNGRIMLVQSSLSDIDKSLDAFNRLGLDAKIVAEIKVPFERIVLIDARLRKSNLVA